MTRADIKKRIIEYIYENNHVTYVELQRIFDEIGYNYHGNLCIISPMCDHVLFWDGWNQDAIDLMNEVQDEGPVHKEPTQFLTYLIDGAGLDLPVVKSRVSYKRDHWLPVVFCKGQERKEGKNNG